MIVILMLLRNIFKETRQEGGESRDLFWLLCTCIRTDRVRKLFIPSLILDEFSRGKLQIPCLCKQQTDIKVFYVTRCSFLHNIEQRLSVFARGCVEKYSAHGNTSQITACNMKR